MTNIVFAASPSRAIASTIRADHRPRVGWLHPRQEGVGISKLARVVEIFSKRLQI